MKLTFITASPEMKEFARIIEESRKAGYELKIINFRDFKYVKKGDSFSFFPNIPDSDVIVLRALFPTMASIEPLTDYLRNRKLKVFDNGLLTHRYSMNKSYDIFKLILAGIEVPDTYSTRNYKDFNKAPGLFSFPMVVKASRAGQGARVWMVKNNAEFKDFISQFEQKGYPAKNIIAQGFVDYKYDLRVLVIGEKMFCMRRIPRKGDFRANFSLGGSVELFPLTEEIKSLARRSVKAVGLEIAGVDVLIDKDDKKYILEVNHTPGMVGIETATGENITRMYLDFVIRKAKLI